MPEGPRVMRGAGDPAKLVCLQATHSAPCCPGAQERFIAQAWPPVALQAFLCRGPSLIYGRPSCLLYIEPPEFSCSPDVYASGTESTSVMEGHLS